MNNTELVRDQFPSLTVTDDGFLELWDHNTHYGKMLLLSNTTSSWWHLTGRDDRGRFRIQLEGLETHVLALVCDNVAWSNRIWFDHV